MLWALRPPTSKTELVIEPLGKEKDVEITPTEISVGQFDSPGSVPGVVAEMTSAAAQTRDIEHGVALLLFECMRGVQVFQPFSMTFAHFFRLSSPLFILPCFDARKCSPVV